MTEPSPFDAVPRAEFADRLETDLLAVIARDGSLSHRGHTTTDPDDEEYVMTLDIDDRTEQPTHRRLARYLAAAAAVIVAVAGITWAVSRDDGTQPADRSPDAAAQATGDPVAFNVKWALSDALSECPFGTPLPPCLYRFELPAAATFTGDIAGPGNQVVLWNEPADYPGQAVDHLEHVITYNLSATVNNCGDGQFMVMELMQFVSGPDHDRDSGTYVGTWQIVPNSGRGVLAAVSGSGTSSGTFGTVADLGRTFTGTISCS